MCGANPMQDLAVHILAGEPLSNHRLRLNARHAQNNRSTCVHWSKSNVRMYFSQRRYRSSGISTFLWSAAGVLLISMPFASRHRRRRVFIAARRASSLLVWCTI